MAFRAASLARHARSLTTQLSRTHHQLPLRLFSHSSIQSSSSSTPTYPIDSLVADVLQTNEALAANPPKLRGRKKAVAREMEEGSTPDLPPVAEWSEYFPWSADVKARASIMNPESAAKVAEAFVPKGSRDKIVVEAFPGAFLVLQIDRVEQTNALGPGVLTRALLNLPKRRIKKLIVLEEHNRFYNFLKVCHHPLLTYLFYKLTFTPASRTDRPSYQRHPTFRILMGHLRRNFRIRSSRRRSSDGLV